MTETDTDTTSPDEMSAERIEQPDANLPVEWVPRDQLEPNSWNPNVMGESKLNELVTSLHDNGWTQPIVVRADEQTIIDGEQRWRAAGETAMIDETVYDPSTDPNLTPEEVPAGYIPIYALDVEDDHARVATMQHNVARGTHDVDKLAELLTDLHHRGMLDQSKDHLNIDDSSLDRLLDRAGGATEPSPPPEEMFEIPWDSDPEDEHQDDQPMVERIDFLVAGDEMPAVECVLSDDLRADAFIAMCEYAVEHDIIEHTREDLKALSEEVADE